MRFVKARFVVALFFFCSAIVLVGGVGSVFFLPWVYSAEVLDGEEIVVIRAPQGGIVRSLRVVKGEKVRADTIVAEIVTTDIQPPDRLVAREILYKRVENARLESQRGGLKQILLKPDLRARIALDRDYSRFVGEQRRLFRAFLNKIKVATKLLREERARLDVQVRGMQGEIASLAERQILLEQELTTKGGAELRAETKRNRRSAQRARKQLRGLQRKVSSNAQALLDETLRVRREESVDMEVLREQLNALYARIGLPKNAFDRLGLVDVSGGGQRLRRLIARTSGRVVKVAEGVLPGDVVVSGEVLAEILPNSRRSSYRLRLQDTEGLLAGVMQEAGDGDGNGKGVKNRKIVRVRSMRCEDFPDTLSWSGNIERGGILLLGRSMLREVDFPSVRRGGRCSVVVGLGGGISERGDFVMGFVRGVFGGGVDWRGVWGGLGGMRDLAMGGGEELWGRLDFLRGEGGEVIWNNFVEDINNSKNK